MLRRRPIAISEHYDRNVVVGITIEFGGETWAVSFRRYQTVPKTLVPNVPPIEIVVGFHEILLLRYPLQQNIGIERAIEAIEVVDGGVQRTVARFVGPVHMARVLEPRDPGWVVARSGVWDQTRSIVIHSRVFHSCGFKNVAPQIIRVTLAADLLQNQCQQVVVGIAVALFGAGSELQWQTGELSNELLEVVRTARERVVVVKA